MSKHDGRPGRGESILVDTWVNQHAAVMLAAAAIAVATGTAAAIAVPALVSFAIFAYRNRASLSAAPFGGYANQLTAARLVVVVSAAVLMPRLSPEILLLLFAVNVALDVADGYVARRTGQVTRFGASFDRETDALFVIVVYAYFFTVRNVPAWVLLPGLLPYVYRLVVLVVRDASAYQGKRRFAAVLAGLNYVCLLLAVALRGAVETTVLLISVAIVAASFLVSFAELYRNEYSVH